MERCSEDQLGRLHSLVGETIHEMLLSDDPREKREALTAAIKFLAQNSITASAKAVPVLNDIEAKLPKVDELEKLMSMTPCDV